MSWNHELSKVTADPKEAGLFSIELTNGGVIPLGVTFTSISAMNKEAQRLHGKVIVSMVTRRSIVNPGEVVKLKVKLPAVAEHFDSDGVLRFELATKNATFYLRTSELQQAEKAGELSSHAVLPRMPKPRKRNPRT
jgi:hypothetical protein